MKAWIEALRAELKRRGDPARARAQQAYMKSAMPFCGVTLPQCRTVFRALMKPLTFASFSDLDALVRETYGKATHREERYAALALLGLKQARAFRTLEAVPLYEWLIVEGAWWDLVDEVATHYPAALLKREPRAIKAPRGDDAGGMANVLRRWSRSDDLWLRRAAIIAQVLSHEDTDLPLLFEVIEPALHEKEFFLRKAIGWALRAAARDFPRQIRAWVDRNADRLSGLSRREAEKGLARALGSREPRRSPARRRRGREAP
jgi:3-methyladenine DNA glycosylase AlkD